MIIKTRKCDGCGVKIESTNAETLPSKTEESRAELLKNGSMFLNLGIVVFGQTTSEAAGMNLVRFEEGEFEICTSCAETRTIASFKLPKLRI